MGRKKNKRKLPGKGKIKLMALEVFESEPNKPFNYKQIAARLNITDSKLINLLIKALGILKSESKIKEIDRGKYKYAAEIKTIQGKLDVTRKGDAFLVSEQTEEDIFIARRNLDTGLHGDTVKVQLIRSRRGKSTEGKVISIENRNRLQFVGTLDVQDNFAFLIPDNPRIHVDFFIPLDKIKGGKNGQKVLIQFTDWPDPKSSPFAKVLEVLGMPGEHNVEMNSILIDNGFPISFPDEVLKEADKIPLEIPEEEIKKRRDFRNVTTFTIDPVDAKDFDDALSIRKIDDEWFEVGVHIADVTHYVQEGTALEKEAAERATSVYLVDRVIPMLPEVLSNQVCSLRPHEDKLTYAAVFKVNRQGDVKDSWIGRTAIHSNHRFAYEEVQEIIEGAPHELEEEVRTLNEMAKALRAKRFQKGGVLFDKVEVRFSLNEEKKPVGVYLKVQREAHKLIEEFMLLANKKVAESVGKVAHKGEKAKTFIYRIHDTPDPEKISDFALFVKRFGYEFKMVKGNIRDSLNAILTEVQGAREASVIENMAIRTMAKAEYSTQNIGHYGLGFEHYSHFTSPIRRYPDMMAHRLLTKYLNGGKSANAEYYEKLCQHASEREREATEAERDSIKYFQVLYMQDAVGKQFKGVVSGMSNHGMFVELQESLCEGMIRLRDIEGDYYFYDEKHFCIKGQNTGVVIHMGDELLVEVAKADLLQKRLDFNLIEITEEGPKN